MLIVEVLLNYLLIHVEFEDFERCILNCKPIRQVILIYETLPHMRLCRKVLISTLLLKKLWCYLCRVKMDIFNTSQLKFANVKPVKTRI